MTFSPQLPFSALVGLDLAQQALLLLAVEPRLRGVVISAHAGTGKSSLARGLKSVLNVPFVEIPPTADVENLIGGLDLEATLQTGHTVIQPGLLSKAHDGISYIDGINLLGDASANTLLSVMDEGVIQVEREGISERLSARFGLIASYDPSEGMPRRHLLDRLGLMVILPGSADVEHRADTVRHNLLKDRSTWQDDEDFLRGVVMAAQEQLPHVYISDEYIAHLSMTALQYGVEGHRVDLFAMYAAKAAAALELRDEVSADDLELAARLVILPRATQVPTPPPEPEEEEPPPPEQEPEQEPDPPEPEDESEQEEMLDDLPVPMDQVLEALASELPETLDELPFRNLRQGRSGSRGTTQGQRGRHIRSVAGDINQSRLDVPATLRAAAPWQPIREHQRPHTNTRFHLRASDVRVKQYQSKAGALFCLAVDASGSMALHRMRQAKGAVHKLLQQAYVNRDQVSLIAFRGDEAELLLPPSQSVELARRALDLLPTGGGTPLASALLLADKVSQQANQRGIFQTVLIILTDGRGNITIHEDEDPREELQKLGQNFKENAIHTVIVDTKRKYLSRGEAKELAEWIGGEYVYLPNANSEEIAAVATAAAQQS